MSEVIRDSICISVVFALALNETCNDLWRCFAEHSKGWTSQRAYPSATEAKADTKTTKQIKTEGGQYVISRNDPPRFAMFSINHKQVRARGRNPSAPHAG